MMKCQHCAFCVALIGMVSCRGSAPGHATDSGIDGSIADSGENMDSGIPSVLRNRRIMTCDMDAGLTSVFSIDRTANPSSGDYRICTEPDEFERRSGYAIARITELPDSCPPATSGSKVAHQYCAGEPGIGRTQCDTCVNYINAQGETLGLADTGGFLEHECEQGRLEWLSRMADRGEYYCAQCRVPLNDEECELFSHGDLVDMSILYGNDIICRQFRACFLARKVLDGGAEDLQ